MFSITPLSGYKFTTPFTVSVTPSSDTVIIDWGDGTYSNTSTATHIYSSHDIFRVIVGNCESTSAFNVSAYRGGFFENKVHITYNTLSAYAGCPNTLTINVSSLTPYSTIHLYSSGSNSIPYQSDRNFWSHLNPEWRFLDVDGNPVAQIPITGTPVYNNNSQLLGYSAMSAVTYVDDMPGRPNLFFTMVLEECSVPINSRVYAGLSYAVSALVPTRLLITADGLNPLNEIQWAGIDNPYLISVYSPSGCKNIMHYASGNITSIRTSTECNGIAPSNYDFPLSTVNLFDQDCLPVGGYLRSSFFVPTSAIPANTYINNTESDPCQQKPINEVEFTAVRHAPVQVTLSARGIFVVNGISYTLTGVSEPFNVYRLENFHQFYRKGEDKTVYDILNKYSHFDLKQTPTYNAYLSAIAGKGDTLGKAYDKITNFAKDHADLDLCTIDNIHDKAQKMDVVIDNYNLEFPEELRRVMNLFSIPLQKLVGTRCVCNTNFKDCTNCCGKNICSLCKFDKRSNVGSQLTLNDTITAGQTILYRENGSEVYEFLPVYSQGGSTVYPLRTLSSTYVYQRGLTNFCYYRWDQTGQGNPVESVIDYLNPETILDRDLITEEDWYDDNGVIEETINYILTKNILNT